jgi:catechol 2,3-dioxygenase-like lactoylglutathione lyase family enzyme
MRRRLGLERMGRSRRRFAFQLPVRLAVVEAQQQPVESISAVTLLTVNMLDAVVFYQALGFHLLYGGPEAPFTSFRVGTGYLNLELDTGGASRRAVWGRVVFWVDDVDAMYRRALAAGFDPESAPADAPWGERYFHIRDRDGHELSFARPLAPRDACAGRQDSLTLGICGTAGRSSGNLFLDPEGEGLARECVSEG